MKRRITLADRMRRLRSRYWRLKRLYFPSPAEVKFLQLMGAKVFIVKRLKSAQTGFPFTVILSRGKVLRAARMRREVRYGKYFVDFANDVNWIIEVDGIAFHDVVEDFDREIYIRELLRKRQLDLRMLRIPAYKLWNQPARLRADVLMFLSA